MTILFILIILPYLVKDVLKIKDELIMKSLAIVLFVDMYILLDYQYKRHSIGLGIVFLVSSIVAMIIAEVRSKYRSGSIVVVPRVFDENPKRFILDYLIISPLFEEMLYRGVLNLYLITYYSIFTTIVISSIIYGLSHSSNKLACILIGLVWSGLQFGCGTIIISILAHMLHNAYVAIHKSRLIRMMERIEVRAKLIWALGWMGPSDDLSVYDMDNTIEMIVEANTDACEGDVRFFNKNIQLDINECSVEELLRLRNNLDELIEELQRGN